MMRGFPVGSYTKKKHKLTLYDRNAATVTATLWLAIIVCSLFLSWLFSK
jgi:hypothetical protein